jgi:hypothetical protein
MVKILRFQDPKYHDVYALYNIETSLTESELNAMAYNIAHSLAEADIDWTYDDIVDRLVKRGASEVVSSVEEFEIYL